MDGGYHGMRGKAEPSWKCGNAPIKGHLIQQQCGAWFSVVQGLMIRSIRDRHILIQFNSIKIEL